MSDQQLNALLAALAATPYTDRASRDAIVTAMERAAALAAGTQSDETPTAAQSEGCQSGPKGNAQ